MTAEPGYPRSLQELGGSLPRDGIDAALRWESVGKTYFFKGDQYWRYNEERRTVDPGYPKPITVWNGTPDGLQGAFISREGCKSTPKLRFELKVSRVDAAFAPNVTEIFLHIRLVM